MRPARGPSREPAVEERAFHRWLVRTLPGAPSAPLALGDDAAALRPPKGRVAIVSTDALVEGRHFPPDAPANAVGRAAAAVSLSDIAAKGATPAGLLLALVVPRGTPERWARSVALGSEQEMARFGAHLVGGDTKSGPTRTLVSTVVGWARPAAVAPRSNARPGDVLLTTGEVGRGGASYRNWRTLPSDRTAAEILRVEPRVREGIALAPIAHAMLDTSDGIAEASRLLAEASAVRVVLDEDRLPLARSLLEIPGTAFRRRGLAFFGGDYELLAAVPPDRVERALRAVSGTLTVVGRVERGRGAYLRTRRGTRVLPPSGWQPFGRAPRRS